MGEAEAALVAERFKALGDPTRVRLVNLIGRHEELCVCELQEYFDLSQPTISHHLGLLRRAGLVESETRGRWAYYRVDRAMLTDLRNALEVER